MKGHYVHSLVIQVSEYSELKDDSPHTKRWKSCFLKLNLKVAVCGQEVHSILGSWGTSQVRHSRFFSFKPNLCLDANLAIVGTAEGATLWCGLASLLMTEGILGRMGLENSHASHQSI